jgi:hypothetical protein
MENSVLINGQQEMDDGLNEIRTRMDEILKSKKPVSKDRGPFCKDFETLLTHEGQCAETERYLINGIRYGSIGVFTTYVARKQKDPVDALNAVISGKTIQGFPGIKKLRFYADILCLVLTEPHYKNMFPICAEKMAILSRGENGHLAKGSAVVVKSEIQSGLKQKTVSYPDLKAIKIRKYADDFCELICAVIDELVKDGKTDEKVLLSLAEWVGYRKKPTNTETATEKNDLSILKQNQSEKLALQTKQASSDLPNAENIPNRLEEAKPANQKVPITVDKNLSSKAAGTMVEQNKAETVKTSESEKVDRIQGFNEFRHTLAMLAAYGAEVSAEVLKLRKENDDRVARLSKAQQRVAELEEEKRKASDLISQQQMHTEELSAKNHELERQIAELRDQIDMLEKRNTDQKQYINHQKQTMSIYQVDARNNSEEEKKALAAKLKPQYRDYKEIAPNKERLSEEEAILVEIIDDIFEILKKSGIDVKV